MATNPYDQAAWSTYTPLSSQEILMPAMLMRERHDKLDEEYATINDELQKVAFIVNNENDPALKQQYNNYMNSLTQSRDTLMQQGITGNSRRQMLDLRGRYQSEIQPINLGYQMKSQDINNYNQMIAKDPTYIGVNPASRTVSDYIKNGVQPFAQQGMSGALLTKMASDALAPLSQLDQVRNEGDLINVLETTVGKEKIPQFMEIARRYGIKPGTEGHKMIMDNIKQNILQSTGMTNWADENQLQQARGYIDMAGNSTIGKTQYQMVNNNAYATAMAKQQAKEEAAAAKLAAQQEMDSLPSFTAQVGITEPYNKRLDEINNDYQGVVNYQKTGKLSDWEIGSGSKKAAYESAIKSQEAIKNMSDAEIDEYFAKNPVSYKSWEGKAGSLSKDVTDMAKQNAKALRDYNSFNELQSNIAKQQGITKEQAAQLAQSYIDNTKTMFGTVYQGASEALTKGEEHALSATKSSMFSNNQTQVYVDGEKKSLKDVPEELRSNIVNKGKILGHSVFNPTTGMSTAIVEYTAEKGEKNEGKTYRVEVPDAGLSNYYTDTRRILKVIRESNTYTPKSVELSDGQKAEVFSQPVDGKWQHFVKIGQDVIPLEQLQKREMNRVKTDYYNRSLTPAQGKYYQSGTQSIR